MELKVEKQALKILVQVDRFLNENKIYGYLVGGFVRDIIIGRSTADIDIAISDDAISTAFLMAERLSGKCVILDEVNRIARVVLYSQSEIDSPLRWHIDFTTIFENILQDLTRRDFTVDAMAINLHSFVDNNKICDLIDPLKGQIELNRKLIKVVNESVFEADPARLLRAVRLAAELEFRIADDTASLLMKSCSLLKQVAGERIREELLRILNTHKAGYFVRYLDNLGFLTVLIPELEFSRGVEQPKEHHWDVLNHSLEAVCTTGFILRQTGCDYADVKLLDELQWDEEIVTHFSEEISSGSSRITLLKLAALLHDIAKPETRIISKERVRFFGHTDQGADVVVGILERLRFSNRETKLVETLIRYHMRPTQMSKEGMPSQKAIYRFFRDSGSSGVDILFLSLADHLAARGPELDILQWKWHVQLVNFVLAEYFRQRKLEIPSRLLNGHDLIKNFNLQPGPMIREMLELVQEAQVAGEIKTRDEALSYIKNRLLYREQKLEK